MMAANLFHNATTCAQVSVAKLKTVSGLYFSSIYESESANISLHSASVFQTSTVFQLYIVMTSHGLYALWEIIFSTKGRANIIFLFSFVDMT